MSVRARQVLSTVIRDDADPATGSGRVGNVTPLPAAHRADWLAIRVELLHGGYSGQLWPPPGRELAVGPKHTFAHLAAAIDQAFARRDLSHLHTFELPDGRLVSEEGYIAEGYEDDPPAVLDSALVVAGGRAGVHLCLRPRRPLDPPLHRAP